jgi:hypothetical protein
LGIAYEISAKEFRDYGEFKAKLRLELLFWVVVFRAPRLPYLKHATKNLEVGFSLCHDYLRLKYGYQDPWSYGEGSQKGIPLQLLAYNYRGKDMLSEGGLSLAMTMDGSVWKVKYLPDSLWVTLEYFKRKGGRGDIVVRGNKQEATWKHALYYAFTDYDGTKGYLAINVIKTYYSRGTRHWSWLNGILFPIRTQYGIDITYSIETSNRKHSWKGGTLAVYFPFNGLNLKQAITTELTEGNITLGERVDKDEALPAFKRSKFHNITAVSEESVDEVTDKDAG